MIFVHVTQLWYGIAIVIVIILVFIFAKKSVPQLSMFLIFYFIRTDIVYEAQ